MHPGRITLVATFCLTLGVLLSVGCAPDRDVVTVRIVDGGAVWTAHSGSRVRRITRLDNEGTQCELVAEWRVHTDDGVEYTALESTVPSRVDVYASVSDVISDHIVRVAVPPMFRLALSTEEKQKTLSIVTPTNSYAIQGETVADGIGHGVLGSSQVLCSYSFYRINPVVTQAAEVDPLMRVELVMRVAARGK